MGKGTREEERHLEKEEQMKERERKRMLWKG
jgi:hypothetical protein